ncbi:MAG TPA: protein kinase [Planctomycetota bacterium]|nr:protein kinase [Planctomycetota bacterium]
MEKKGAQPAPTPIPPAEAQSGPGGAFGRILVERGLATDAQLEKCLAIQMARAKKGDFVRLGAILVEEGILTPPQVAEVLQQQAITVVACEACGAQYNVSHYSPLKQYECRRCHGRLVPPQQGKLQNVNVQDAVEEARSPNKTLGKGVPALPGSETVRVPVDVTGTGKIRQRRSLGRYEILGEIARGGMGVIYKARQLDLERVVAVKTLRADEAKREDAMERFRREARAIAALRHPNVVAVHDVGQVEEIPYFTMEFIEGLPLDRRLVRGPLEGKEAIEILAPIAEALHYCHGEGVVHRDLKPANIIVDSHGHPFLVDFGIAVRKAERGPDLDSKDELLGSIPYMAPEYVDGAAYDERCDVYSFGVVLYEILCGHEQFPYFDASTTRLLEKISSGAPVDIRERFPSIDEDLACVVMKAIARNRDERYPTAGALAQDLRAYRRGDPVSANPLSQLQLLSRQLKKQAPPAVAIVLAVTTVAFAAWGFRSAHSRDEALRNVELLKSDVEAARRDRDAEIARQLFATSRAYEEAGKTDKAIGALTSAIDKLRPYGSGMPLLAEAFDRRGVLRLACGQIEGEDDRVQAGRLDPRFARRH